MATPPNDRIKVRWRKGWAAIPNAVLRDKRLSRNARLLWCVLVSYAGNDETAWPSQDELAKDCSEDDAQPTLRSIQRWLKELEDAGWLTRHRSRYGNDYELHEPNDTDVASDTTPVSHQTRHQDRVAPDTSVASDPTPGSHALKNKTHGTRLNHQDSSSSADADAAGAAGGDGGAVADGPTVAWLTSIGVKTRAALRDLGSLDLIYLRQQWAEFQAENAARARPLTIGAFVEQIRANPTPAPLPPPPPDPAVPADDARRPAWISADHWQGLTDPQRDALALSRLLDGRVEARYEDLTEIIYARWAPTIRRLIEETGAIHEPA